MMITYWCEPSLSALIFRYDDVSGNSSNQVSKNARMNLRNCRPLTVQDILDKAIYFHHPSYHEFMRELLQHLASEIP